MIVIRCDNTGHVWGSAGLLPQPKFWSFSFSNISSYPDIYTDVVDLGENHVYTLLVAIKIGPFAVFESIEIQTSVDGVLWAPAFADYTSRFIAKNESYHNWPYLGVWGRPIGRYVRVFYDTGVDAEGDITINLIAFSGI